MIILLVFLVCTAFFAWVFVSWPNWHKNSHFNLVFWTGKRGGVISWQPRHDRVVVLSFPENTHINLPFEYGQYQAKAVYQLGEQEKIGGQKLWQRSVQSFLGVTSDGALVSPDLNSKKIDKKTIRRLILRSGLFKSPGFKNKLMALFYLWGKRSDQILALSLEEQGGLSLKNLADKSQVYQPKPALDDLVRTYMIEPFLANQDVRVVVLNSTSYSGLGKQTARVLENSGLTVVHLGNIETQANSEVQVVSGFEKRRAVYDWLENNFSKNINQVDEVFSGRGEVAIVVGQDQLNSTVK